MSMVLTRSPLEPIGMNGAGTQKRRSARLSRDGAEGDEPPAKKSRVNGAQTTTISTKEQDGDTNAAGKRRPRKVYTEEVDDFAFKRGGRKAKEPKQLPVRNSTTEQEMPPPPPRAAPPAKAAASAPVSTQAPEEEAVPKPVLKKVRRKFPTTPEREAAEKPSRRSKRLSIEHESSDPQPSPHRAAHAKSHTNTERSPSPERARPITVEKKRKRDENGAEEEQKTMRIALPFQDTPVIRRNQEMRKGSGDGHRRSSSSMRGRRASSLIDEGRGNAMPHAEVTTSEFYKHISADLTEPRRMRCLLGWCGTRALPSKPDAPKDSTPASSLEFQALQAARVIQDELSQDLLIKGTLSDWFSRDEAEPPQIPLKKKPNPRNVTNATKAEELERELDRLKKERVSWDDLMKSAVPPSSPAANAGASSNAAAEGCPLSPLRPELLDSPEREIFEQLRASSTDISTDPALIQQRLHTISSHLEFAVDSFAHGVHALGSSRDAAERLAEKTLADAADALQAREKARRGERGQGVDALSALRALGKVMNGRRR
ncbi:hypothetical protein LTR08_004544 [Meristemomyces frigidus]|nr:hypothetical protein LTR08_004544 [Meristemomyces frigidus]